MIDRTRLIDQLQIHEGVKTKLYRDSRGYWTIGVGRNLSTVGISLPEAVDLLNHDIDSALNECDKYAFFRGLDPIRQNAVTELMFNMGADVFSSFHRFIAAMSGGEYPHAAAELAASQWRVQVGPARFQRLHDMVALGVWPL